MNASYSQETEIFHNHKHYVSFLLGLTLSRCWYSLCPWKLGTFLFPASPRTSAIGLTMKKKNNGNNAKQLHMAHSILFVLDLVKGKQSFDTENNNDAEVNNT